MKHYIFSIVLLAGLLASCTTTQLTTTRGEQYARMYAEDPVTILIMPPINQTTFVEAKDYFYTTLYMPLVEKGYYVYSPYMTLQMLEEESAYDSEMFLNSDLSAFRKILNADAAIFTIIKSWSRSKMAGSLTCQVEYIIRSTKTGETLYTREGEITVDTSVRSGSGGLLGSLIDMAATAINTASTDKVVAGRLCNAFVLSDLPEGKYGTQHQSDSSLPAGKSFFKGTTVAK
ncbi:MAG: DUF799 family lipoprotein [Bacteroidales bacterium]|nr:DUF799 family lipoprotein [Bacteroidales bacterium]MBP5214144.1 DUF799 family lipoprotein [Bacteroidales bacterium]